VTKPHLHPVTAPNGRVLTRVSPPDHPWHRGIWFAIKYVNGENFWEEPGDRGTGAQSADAAYGDQYDVGGGHIEWRRANGDVVIDEQRDIVWHGPGGDGSYAIDWTSALTPRVDVALDRTPYTTWGGYGGLAFRGANDWIDTRILLADGSVHRRPEGVPSPWCDLSSADAGITFLDHPGNPRYPVHWYGATMSRVYGDDGWSNFLNAAFLFHQPMSVPAGETLTFRYRMLVHDGMWGVAQCGVAWEAWAVRTV
jgi:hypothetical protein